MKKTALRTAFFILVLLMGMSAYAAERIELPSGLSTVEAQSFYGDASIREVIVSENVTRIESLAFADSGLEYILLEDGIELIAEDAFDGCENLEAECSAGSYAHQYCLRKGIEIAPPSKVIRILQSEDAQSYRDSLQKELDAAFEKHADLLDRRVRVYHHYAESGNAQAKTVDEIISLGADMAVIDLADASRAADFAGKLADAGIECLFIKTEPDKKAVLDRDLLFIGSKLGLVPRADLLADACGEVALNRLFKGKWIEGTDYDSADGWSLRLKAAPVLTGKKIGIDPGHQKKGNYNKEYIGPNSKTKKAKVSSGTSGVSTGTAEYVRNLEISLKLRDALKELGAEVYMTRETHNVDISNKERALMMNDLGVDLVLRIHCNGSSSKSAKGMELYVNKTGSIAKESLKAAEKILPAMVKATGAKNRGVKKSDSYTGLNWSTVPCILVECGFMSNADEDKKLADSGYQKKLVKGMADGICDYMGV